MNVTVKFNFERLKGQKPQKKSSVFPYLVGNNKYIFIMINDNKSILIYLNCIIIPR